MRMRPHVSGEGMQAHDLMTANMAHREGKRQTLGLEEHASPSCATGRGSKGLGGGLQRGQVGDVNV